VSILIRSRLHRSLRSFAGLLVLLCATFTVMVIPASTANAGGAGGGGCGCEGDTGFSLSVSAAVSAPTSTDPTSSQPSYTAAVTLTYVLSNAGEWPISEITLYDPLLLGSPVQCSGWPLYRVLPPQTSVTCTAEITLPPKTYTSRPRAVGRVDYPLSSWQVSAQAMTQFTVAAPPPPPPPPPPPVKTSPPKPAPVVVVRTTPPPPPPPKPTPTPTPPPPPPPPSPKPKPTYHAIYIPPQPAAAVKQLPTHQAVMLLMLPAAAAAAVAGAALASRRR